MTAFNHPNTTITRVRQDAQKMLDSQKENAMQHSAATGSAILDTYLQFITENTFGESINRKINKTIANNIFCLH